MKRLRLFIPGLGAVLVLGVWLFREPLRQQLRESATLANDAPAPEVVADLIKQAADPRAALLAGWNSGEIVHREVAIRSLSRVLSDDQPLSPELDSLLLSAALDPDMNVRESALGILRERQHPALAALAAEQLRDCDPQVRWLGLNQLKYVTPAIGVPAVLPLLDDADPFIVTLGALWFRPAGQTQFAAYRADLADFTGHKLDRLDLVSSDVAEVRRWLARKQSHGDLVLPPGLHGPPQSRLPPPRLARPPGRAHLFRVGEPPGRASAGD